MTQAFEIITPRQGVQIPLLVHVPHSSTVIPAGVRTTIGLSDEELEAELLVMTDRYTDELFARVLNLGGMMFVNRMSRLVMDPERFPNDLTEVECLPDDAQAMEAKGLGPVYTRTAGGKPLRISNFSASDRRAFMDRFFKPYAEAVANQVGGLLTRFGRCLIIDAHSFPSVALPFEDKCLTRPDVCLGYEGYHAPGGLVGALEMICQTGGYTVARNEPYAGSYVPLRFYRREPAVRSVMVEVNRGTYMDETNGERIGSFRCMVKLAGNLLEEAASSISLRP